MANILVEGVNIVPAFTGNIADMDTDQTGDHVSLKGYGKCGVLFINGAGTNGDIPTLTLQQSTVVAGTDAKVATVIDTHWIKQAATSLAATATFTKTAQTLASTIVYDASSDTEVFIDYFEVNAEDLDVDNGFDCIRANVALAASGGAQQGSVIYILQDPRYPQATSLDAITD